MKTSIIKSILAGLILVGLAARALAQAQNPFSFTGVRATEEGAIILNWESETNTFYDVMYTDNLIDPDTGLTIWSPLYLEYPSHGTNTFIGDYGNFLETPITPHPKDSPARFYRIFWRGTNTAPTNPTISITAPTNGSTVSGELTISINASSDQIITERKLYVDGQLMKPSPDSTNFTINTCEWPNGPHTLFATVKSQSALEGIPTDTSVTYGRAVSPYLTVTFDNLITKLAFSQWFFKPSLSQTQIVSASFTLPSNWTLEIQNADSNTVRTVTGSGETLGYAWDGTGQGDTNLPAGVYTYLITAATNGAPPSPPSGGGGGTNDPPPSPGSASASSSSASSESSGDGWYPRTARQATAAGWSSYFIDYPPLPPYRSNGVWVVPDQQPPTEVPLNSEQTYTASSSSSFSMDSLTPDANTPTSQATRGPERPPTAAVRDAVGTFGMGWQVYPGGVVFPAIPSGFPLPLQFVKVDTNHTVEGFGDLSDATILENNFMVEMMKHAYDPALILNSRRFQPVMLQTNIFNQVNLALILLHSSFANTAESTSTMLHIYLRFWDAYGTKATSNVKMDQLSLGAPGTNGLKWVAFACCSSMRDQNWDSMKGFQKLPINNDLHLMLGASTVMTAAPNLGKLWASNMLAGVSVEESWYSAGQGSYRNGQETNNIVINFDVAGWPNCFNDGIGDTAKIPASGDQNDIDKHSRNVFP
jgi:Big-like domain-containing protein/uncharacterized protein DUF6345/flagellar hook capping protein FlgD